MAPDGAPAAPGAAAGSVPGTVLVMGAGAIGCHLGGRLQAAGVAVRFVGRPRVLDALRVHGLTLTDLDGSRVSLPPSSLDLSLDLGPRLSTVSAPSLVLLCVKSGATAEAARGLAAALPSRTLVLSMQNGVSNAGLAQAEAPTLRVLPGMVPYNVAELGPGRFHRGSAGTLAAQDDPALRPWLPAFAGAGLPLTLHADLSAIQWGKLLLNLNNPVNALSGLPLRAQLLDRDCRRCTAALIEEALTVLQAAGIAPAQVGAVAPTWLPALLRLPTPLFRRVAARMLRIDEKARSSMADDRALGRPTEIDALCGEVVRLAVASQRLAPRNARMATLLKSRPTDSGPISGAHLLRLLLAG